MNLQEQLYRIKEMMGLHEEESDNCYPSDYFAGKEYERDELSEIFSCIAGRDNFPVEGVKEWMFPLVPPNKNNPVHHSPIYDPKNMDMGYDGPVSMEGLVDTWKSKVSHLSLEKISITPQDIHPSTLKFISEKESSVGGEDRISFQMRKIMDMGIWSVTEFEPFVIEKREDKYKWDEGWNRLIAMMRLYNENKIPRIEGKAWVVYRID